MSSIKGKWISECGHKIWFLKMPLLKSRLVVFKPQKGRYRLLVRYEQESDNFCLIGLHFLGLMEAMMYLWQASDLKTKEPILIPEIEEGPETR